MGLACAFGFHQWDGCKCTKCGKTRDEGHDWSKDCEKCSRCGAIKVNAHQWDGCRCTKCVAENHDWSKDCEKCFKCGKTRDGGHDWSRNCEYCSKCDKHMPNAHQWEDYKCIKCGRPKHNRDTSNSLLIDGVTSGSVDKARRALDAGADVNCGIKVRPVPGSLKGLEIGRLLETVTIEKYPLNIALDKGHIEVAKVLLKRRGRLVEISRSINPWNDVLLRSAGSGRADIATLALEQGANINCQGIHSTTPLIMASMFGHKDVVRFLLDKGADYTLWSSDPMLQTRKDRTALMWANSEGHQEVVRILKEAGARE